MPVTRGQKRNRAEDVVAASKAPKTLLPVTLLSGFLGAGKTTLLRHILANTLNLRVAVLVNDMAEVNVDGDTVSELVQCKEQLVQLQNGCICCTLRADLVEQVGRMARSGKFDLLVIESTGISEPMQVAETFAVELSGPMNALQQSGHAAAAALGALSDCARLDTCVTMIDAAHFWEQWESTQTVQEDSMGADVAEDDDRSLSGLLTEQVEFADVLVINKIDLVDKKMVHKLKSALRGMNTEARILEADHGVVPLEEVLRTGKFNLDRASKAAGWMQELLKPGGHNPETLEFGISSFIYRASRPFHPGRLYKWIESYFAFTADAAVEEDDEESDEEEEPTCATPAALRAAWCKVHGAGRLLRSKGIMWIACYHWIGLNWNQVGQMGYLHLGVEWNNDGRASQTHLPRSHKYGDRRSELVFIGQDINQQLLTEEMDKCLVSDSEFNKGAEKWAEFEDPFEMLPEDCRVRGLGDTGSGK